MKKIFFKCIALIVAVAAFLSLAGCAKQPINEIHAKDYKEELVMPASSLDASALYSSIKYTPKMFSGDYFLKAGVDSRDEYLANSDFWNTDISSPDGKPHNLTLIPMRICVGGANFGLNSFTEYTWGEVHFLSEEDYLVYMTCAIEVKNNDTLCLTPLADIEQLGAEDNYKVVSYTLSDVTLEYSFEFSGFDLTLSANGKSVELRATDLTDYMRDYGSDLQISTDGYRAANSPRIDNIEAILFLANSEKTKYNRFYLEVDEGGSYCETYEATGILGEDGLFTFSYTDNEGNAHSYQFLYFYLDDNGIVLFDGETTYFYTSDYFTHLDGMVSEEDAWMLEEMTPEEYAALAKKKESLFDALSAAFEKAGIAANVDPLTGEIAIPSAVLFDVNESAVSGEGKAFLTAFWEVYTSVISADEYTDFLESIVIEGHADPSGNYADNMVLSEARANSVLEFCNALGGSTASLEAVGYSSSRPVIGADGEADYDASRRVAFRFIIKL